MAHWLMKSEPDVYGIDIGPTKAARSGTASEIYRARNFTCAGMGGWVISVFLSLKHQARGIIGT